MSVQYFYPFSTWTSKPSLYLEDLFVIPTLRNKGVGKLLFKALGQIAQQKDCARIYWSVLKWNAWVHQRCQLVNLTDKD